MSEKTKKRGRPKLTPEQKAKRKGVGGRPKKTLDCLPKGWEEGVISLGKEGASDVEIRGYLGISDDLWDRFLIEEPTFSRTIKEARTQCRIWWERTGREGCFMGGKDNPFNATVWIFNMKNRFKWTDRTENTSTVNLVDELKDLADRLPD